MSEYENEAPTGDVQDPEYVSRTGQSHIPVAKDDASIEDPINAETADSDKQLGRHRRTPNSLSLHIANG